MSLPSKIIVMVHRPEGKPSGKLGEHFEIQQVQVSDSAPTNGVLVCVKYISADPYLRGQMHGTLKEGTPLVGFVAGKVLKTGHAEWKEGDLFGAHLPFATVQQVTDMERFIKLTDHVDSEQDLSLGIGLLGMPGSTAYGGIDLMKVTEQDRVWISACTGAVGSLAGQICKNVRKCQLVVGSCGSKEKCELAKQKYGYDECFNYHEMNPDAGLHKVAPDGVDFVFENVGGDHFIAAVNHLRPKGRLAVCGAVSKYNEKNADLQCNLPVGKVVYNQLHIEGFLSLEWLSGKRGNFFKDMYSWYKQGLVTKQETMFEGIESWPEAFATLFQPGNTHVGKVVVKV